MKVSCGSSAWWKDKLYIHMLPIGFFLAIVFGLSIPSVGSAVADLKYKDNKIVQSICIIIIFLISGMSLKTEDLQRAVKYWPGVLYGFIAICGITPCISFGLIYLPFNPKEFAMGLALFSCAPTTINSGIMLTTIAKGNDAVSLLLTVITNLVGSFTVPFLLKRIFSSMESVSLDQMGTLIYLLAVVIGPLLIGKLITLIQKVKYFIKKYKKLVGCISNICLIIIVWTQISVSSTYILNTKFVSLLLLIVSGIVLHISFLCINFVPLNILYTKKYVALPEFKAVLLVSSQKALPICIAIISQIKLDTTDEDRDKSLKGLMTIPCVICHICQLFFDSWFAGKLSTIMEKKQTKLNEKENEKNKIGKELESTPKTDYEDKTVQEKLDLQVYSDNENNVASIIDNYDMSNHEVSPLVKNENKNNNRRLDLLV